MRSLDMLTFFPKTMVTRGVRSFVLTAMVGMAALVGMGTNASAQTSTYYVTDYQFNSISGIQGGTVVSYTPMVFSLFNEQPIAVYGDVRTLGHNIGNGGQYSLGLVPTSTTYLPNNGPGMADATTDGTHNYGVSTGTISAGTSFITITDRDWSNPSILFNVTNTSSSGLGGVTYDRANNSLWVQDYENGVISDYSMTGTLLSSFSTFGTHYPFPAQTGYVGLAYDPADNTLWFTNHKSNWITQFSTSGIGLQSIQVANFSGIIAGGEFNEAISPNAVPEPAAMISLVLGIIGMAGIARRRATKN